MSEAIGDSVTVDEFAHLPAGLYYLETGHFDVYNLSPPLLRELAALPVLAARPAGDFARFTTFPEHPVCRGVTPFTVNDGWLYKLRFVPGMKGVTPLLLRYLRENRSFGCRFPIRHGDNCLLTRQSGCVDSPISHL